MRVGLMHLHLQAATVTQALSCPEHRPCVGTWLLQGQSVPLAVCQPRCSANLQRSSQRRQPHLDHEVLDNTVEGAVLEAKALLAGAQGTEVLGSPARRTAARGGVGGVGGAGTCLHLCTATSLPFDNSQLLWLLA